MIQARLSQALPVAPRIMRRAMVSAAFFTNYVNGE
jgi:hypothetical protein